MIVIISPAKSLDFSNQSITNKFSHPIFIQKSKQLVDILKQKSPKSLADLMSISPELALLNYSRYQEWCSPFNTSNAKQAILTFSGDVYTGFEANSMNEQAIQYSQSHLRILSGLYGVLKPLDLIQAYRLEMGTKLTIGKHKNLYSFWSNQLTENINLTINETKSSTLVNLASNEYAKSLQLKDVKSKIVTPIFKDWKNGQYKIISFFAKKARGLMAKYIINHQIKNPDDLKGFNVEGYSFNEELSKTTPFTFTRDSF